MNYITPAKMREMDKRAQEEFDIPVTILMENAGRAVFQTAMEMLSGKENKKVVVVSGSGNNGGDALVAARHLMNNGIETAIFSIVPMEQLYGEAKANYIRAEKVANTMSKSIRILSKENLSVCEDKMIEAQLIIDGIFGTGLDREVQEPQRTVIQLLNESQKSVLAVDVPSGLDATDGKILGVCVEAEKTVTFAQPKTGFRGNEKYTGKVITADISIPKVLLEN